MRPVRLQLANIRGDPRNFGRLLLDARVITRTDGYPSVPEDASKLYISFVGFRPGEEISIDDLGVVALLARAYAESGRSVEIELPRSVKGRPSRVQRFIDRIGFCALFLQTPRVQWQSNIKFKGNPEASSEATKPDSETHYIQYRWVSVDDFVFAPTDNLYLARPTIHPRVDRQFRATLRSLGFADAQTIDLLANTMFLELGWNVVLHAGRIPGAAVGIFGAQIKYTPRVNAASTPARLTFCISDIGSGIPSTLGSAYRNEPDPKFRLRSTNSTISEPTDIVRYALYPHSTCRTQSPSEFDRSGFRGLAFVASTLMGTGDMTLRSDGGAVLLTGTQSEVETKPIDDFVSYPIIGTQVVGRLNRTPEVVVETPIAAQPHTLPDFDIVPICDLNGRCSRFSDLATISSLIDSLQCQSACILFDVGYGEGPAKNLEFLCHAAVRKFPDRWLIFWSTTAQWSELQGLQKWLEPQNIVGLLPPLVVRGFGDARFIGFTDLSSAKLHFPNHPALPWIEEASAAAAAPADVPVIRSARLTAATYLSIAAQVNTRYVARGFLAVAFPNESSRNGDSGFFRGTIHLLRGPPAAHEYFSLLSNLASSEANVRRWSESCAAAMIQLLAVAEHNQSRLVLLGFTGTMREVIGRAYLRLGWSYPAYMLLTFDVPSKEEVESKIHTGDHVLLATDVISTGSLVEAVSSLVTRVGATVTGVVSLINTRGDASLLQQLLDFGVHRLPVIATAQMRSAGRSELELGEEEFWVDPVSLVPIRQRAWGWSESYDQKIEQTVRLIILAHALRCGHIIDGTRHTSVYVDLQAMLEKGDGALRDCVSATVDACLGSRSWNGFNPSIVLYPGGISRVEPVRKQSAGRTVVPGNVTVYDTAVNAYVRILLDRWKSMTPVEVLRAFDPGGGSQCARAVELPDMVEKPVSDVIIADDGMWSGGTVNALLRLAISLGAKRILILPLLARISPNEAEQLGSVALVSGRNHAENVELCYGFPMLLPVPFYRIHDCPYEVTMDRLRDRRQGAGIVGDLVDRLLESLKGRTPTEASSRTAEFSDMWLRLRLYVELASVNQDYLEKLTELIRGATADERLLSMFLLFTEEWRLLGRSRLRQAVRPQLRSRALEACMSPGTTREVRIAALTLLRSLFCETFVERLPDIPALIIEDVACLERAVLHVATLNQQWHHARVCLVFADYVAETGPSVLARASAGWNQNEIRRYFEAVRGCKALSIELRALQNTPNITVREAARELLVLLADDPDISHKTRPVVEIISKSAESIHQLDANQFAVMKERWRVEHEPRIASQILPRLKHLRVVLMRAATGGHDVATGDYSFLHNECAAIQECLGGLSGGLNFLPQMITSEWVVTTVVSSAARLLQDVLDRQSTTVRLLRRLRSTTVGRFCDDFSGEVESHFAAASRKVIVSRRKNDAFNASVPIFAPPDLLRDCIANVLDNLRRYASTPEGALHVEIGIDEQYSQAGDPHVVINIRNDGVSMRPDVSMGKGGRRIAADLEIFQGRYFPPSPLLERPWTVLHRMSFALW